MVASESQTKNSSVIDPIPADYLYMLLLGDGSKLSKHAKLYNVVIQDNFSVEITPSILEHFVVSVFSC